MLIYSMNKFICRRKQLLGYFGEIFDESKCNKGCDNCKKNRNGFVEETGVPYLEVLNDSFKYFQSPPLQSKYIKWL